MHHPAMFLQGFIGEDGTVHMVAEDGQVEGVLGGLDLERARLLAQVTSFWEGRARWISNSNFQCFLPALLPGPNRFRFHSGNCLAF